MSDDGIVEAQRPDAPGWVLGASSPAAFRHGLLTAFHIPGLVLFSTSIGFGALAKDLGFALGHTVLLSAVVYATPAQIVLIDQLARGAALTAAAFAVTLTAIRLLPMVVTLIPYLRHERNRRWQEVLAVHFVAITAWVVAQQRLPAVPSHLRLPHFLGIGSGLVASTVAGAAFGFFLAATLPGLLSAALLFMTPLYFLVSMIATARSRPDHVAIAAGCILGPVFFVLTPDIDLLATGVVGGSIAYLWRRSGK